jgi:RNA polymerase sigma-70 factor, ECF subfamily
VFEQHGAFACRILRSLGVHEADLDDMLQEVFLVVCRRQSDYEEQGRARSWMYSICRRVATAQHRGYVRERQLIAGRLRGTNTIGVSAWTPLWAISALS